MQGFTPKVALRSAVLSACATAVVFLSGCAGMTGTAAPNSLEVSSLSGSLHGGIQAIVGAHVYLYAANIASTYGSAAESKMTAGSTGTGQDYVITDSHGSFSYGGTFTCPAPDTQMYLLALGGNSGGSGTNGAIALSAALGDCSSINSSTFTNISEATTVAMAYALNGTIDNTFKGFMTDPTHVGAPPSNIAGLKSAFATAANLVDSSTGAARTTTPGGNGTVPQRNLNTLANILAACVNASSSSDANCTSLFANTAANSVTPTETLTAALHIASFPGANVTNLYNLAAPINSFQPALTSQPNDFSIGITFTPGFTVVQPSAVVIDAGGNIWMANCKSCLSPTAVDTLLEFSSTGTFLHSYNGSSNAATQVLHNIKGIAIDAAGANIYTVNQGISGGSTPGTGDDQIIKMSTTTGLVQSGFPVDFDQASYNGRNNFQGIALDNSGEIWATASNTGAVVELTPAGFLTNGSPFFIGPNVGVGTDNQGYIWLAGDSGQNLLQWDTFGDFLANFTPPTLNNPISIALNSSNQIWTINNGNKSLTKFDPNVGPGGTDTAITGVGIASANTVAIDGSNRLVIPNCRAGCIGSGSVLADGVIRLSSAGALNTGAATAAASTMQVPNLSGPSGVAIDAAGNAWIANNTTGTLTEVVGFAVPTRQPLAAASLSTKIGQRP